MITASVVAVKGGFSVQMYINLGRDEMIEALQHCYVFARKESAVRLAAQVQKAQKFNSQFWLWDSSVCSPLAFMHKAPTAVRVEVP